MINRGKKCWELSQSQKDKYIEISVYLLILAFLKLYLMDYISTMGLRAK